MAKEKKDEVKTAEEAIKNVYLIVSDMRKNRKEYDAKDLGWRCVDVSLVLIETMGLMIEALKKVERGSKKVKNNKKGASELKIEKTEQMVKSNKTKKQ